MIKRAVLAFALLVFVQVSSRAAEPWRPGHIYCPDISKSTPKGEMPSGVQIVLENGTLVDVASLASDDAFAKLIEHWVRARKDYHSDPTMVGGFAYRLDSMEIGPGVRDIEIRYEGAGLLVHMVKGVTHAIR